MVLGGGGQRAEPTPAGHLEEHEGSLRDLVLGDRLAEVRLDEVVGVAHQHLDVLVVELGAELVAGDPDVDRRDVQPADSADDLLAAAPLRHLRGQVADEAARLVCRIVQPHDVGVVVLEDATGDALLGSALRAVVGDRELRVRELVGDGLPHPQDEWLRVGRVTGRRFIADVQAAERT